MQQENQYLFVYGSLLSGFKSPAYEYLAGYFHQLGEAATQGALLHNGEFPVGVQHPEAGFIKGELWKLNSDNEYEWAFAQLDDYEGLNVMPGESPLYKRVLTPIHFRDEQINAWVYWYNGSVEGMHPIASGDVFDFYKNMPH